MLGEAITKEQIQVATRLGSQGFVEGFSREASLVATVTMAFSTDPVARWVYPKPADYFRWFPGFVRAFAGRAIEDDTAISTSNYSGVALWLRPGAHPDESALSKLVTDSLPVERQAEMFELFEKMDAGHPAEDHWYLPMIGVDTFQQNLGIGSGLMKLALERSDEQGLPAYLESSNPRNISLYLRFGFRSVGEIRAGGSPPLVRMLREPARADK
jgi:ribosomal protein S18 acetylase RimI-like enzyme